MKKLIVLFNLLFCSTFLFAQKASIDMADELRGSGKIYVVVAVMVILFVSFIIYLFTIEKRLKKIEREK